MTWKGPALSRLTDRVRERSGRAADPVRDDQRGVHAWLRRAPVIPLAELRAGAFQQLPPASGWEPGTLARLAAGVRMRPVLPEVREDGPGRLEVELDGWRLDPLPIGTGEWLAAGLWAGVPATLATGIVLWSAVTVALLGAGAPPAIAAPSAGVAAALGVLLGLGLLVRRIAAGLETFTVGARGVRRGRTHLSWDQLVDVARHRDRLEFRAVDGRVIRSPALQIVEMDVIEPFARDRLRASLVDEHDDDGLRRAVHALTRAGR